MQVKEIMTQEVETISSSESIRTAAQKMKSLNVGILPVMEGNELAGMVTDRDIVVRGIAEQDDITNILVRDVMSGQVFNCSGDDSVEDAVKMMEDNQVRRLIVLDEEGSAVGIVSLGDVAAKTHYETLAGEALEAVSEPCYPSR